MTAGVQNCQADVSYPNLTDTGSSDFVYQSSVAGLVKETVQLFW